MDNISGLLTRLKPGILKIIEDAGFNEGGAAATTQTTIVDDSTYLKQTNSPTLLDDLPVAAGVRIDNVDISELADQYATHIGNDTHQQYAAANDSGLNREAYQAARLSKSVIAGNGLVGGGLLDASRTLDVGAGFGISVAADTVAVDQAMSPLWSGMHQFQQKMITHDLEPDLADTRKIGTTDKRYLTADISEINATVFSEHSIHPIGGFFLVTKDQGVLASDVPAQSVNTLINFGRVMTLNDIVEFRDNGKIEYMKVLTASGVPNAYSCQRDLDGSGANFWAAGSVFAVKGQVGDGYLALNAYDSPRMQVWKKGAAHNDDAEQVRIGDLNGNWGYGASTFGVAIGEYAANKPNITIDPVNGLRIRNYTTDTLSFDTLGNAEITGTLEFFNKFGRIGFQGLELDIDKGISSLYAFTADGIGGSKEQVGGISGFEGTTARSINITMNASGKSKHGIGFFGVETSGTGYEARTTIKAKHSLREAYAEFLATSTGKTINLVADTTTITGSGVVSSNLTINGNLTANGNNTLGNSVFDWQYFNGTAVFYDDVQIQEDLTVTGTINGSLITPSWINASLQNSWINLSTLTYKGAAYCKNALGKICLRGVIYNGTFANGTVLFNLPSGYRPDRRRIFTAAGHGNVGVRIDIDTNGNVMVYGATGNSFLSLDEISFYPV